MIELLLLLAKDDALGPIGDMPNTGLGPYSSAVFWGIGPVSTTLTKIISNIVAVITVSAGIWFMIQFLVGAFKWITSGGDKGNVEAAKEHLTHAVIGLAIIVASYVLTGLIGAIFGLDILNPQIIISQLKP